MTFVKFAAQATSSDEVQEGTTLEEADSHARICASLAEQHKAPFGEVVVMGD